MIKIRFLLILGITVILYSNFLTAFFVNYIHINGKYIPLSKDFFIIILTVALFFLNSREKKIIKLNIYILLFFLLIAISYIISNDGIFNKTYNLRRIIMPLIIFSIFSNINIRIDGRSSYFVFIKYNFFLFCLFGIVEYFNTRLFWDYLISINRYWSVNSVESHGMVDFFTEVVVYSQVTRLLFLGLK